MNRDELFNDIRNTLSKSGFFISELCSIRPIGFDLVARRDNSLLIIKVLINIDAIPEDVANELKVLSGLLKGVPLLIGERSSSGKIESDVVYDRFGIKAISPETLKNHLLKGIPLDVYAGPGGYYVNLDTERIIKLRHEHNYSLGSFARSVRVSRRTVRMYEEGMNARVEIVSRIEDLFNTNVTKTIDILNPVESENKGIIKISGESEEIPDFQKEIFKILERVGYKIIPLERCPFEAVSRDKDKVLLTCVHRYNDKLKKKIKIVGSISRIVEKHAVLFTDKESNKTNIRGTPIIIKKELKKIRGPEEILELIIERLDF